MGGGDGGGGSGGGGRGGAGGWAYFLILNQTHIRGSNPSQKLLFWGSGSRFIALDLFWASRG